MRLGWDHRLCFAGSLVLADLLGIDRSTVVVLEVPELASGQRGSPVELVVGLGGRRVALEHTLIESYPEQIGDGRHIRSFMDLVRSAIPGELPQGRFTLVFGSDSLRRLTGRRAELAAQQVAELLVGEISGLAAAERPYAQPLAG